MRSTFIIGKGYDMGGGRSNYVACQDTAVDPSRVGPGEGDRPRSPKNCASRMPFACRNTAVEDDRPPVSRIPPWEGDHSWSPRNCASQMPLHIVTRRSGMTALPDQGSHLGRATVLGRRNATLSSTCVIGIGSGGPVSSQAGTRLILTCGFRPVGRRALRKNQPQGNIN
jgi:hypothetical protein